MIDFKGNVEREKLEDSLAFYKTAFDNTAIGMAVVTMDRKYLVINDAYCNIIGYSREELFNMCHKDFAHPEDREMDEPFVKELLSGEINSFKSIKRYLHKRGHIVWGQATISIVRNNEGKPKYFVAQIQDISAVKFAQVQLEQAKEKAELLASTDYLTGCLNRRAFIESLQKELTRARRENTETSLVLVDIDFFKEINDMYGHLTGDYVLQHFSKILFDNCRRYDFIGRFGGEEFIICLPNTNAKDAFVIADRMRCFTEYNTFYITNISIKITASFGVATCNHGIEEGIDSFISRADSAMYQAKSTRNNVFLAC